jgi:hypothetical protein
MLSKKEQGLRVRHTVDPPFHLLVFISYLMSQATETLRYPILHAEYILHFYYKCAHFLKTVCVFTELRKNYVQYLDLSF